MMYHPAISGGLLLIAVGGAGCRSAPVPPAAALRDSAGIEVIENPAPATATDLPLHLSTELLLRLDQLDAPAAQQFGRTVRVRLLADAVAVLDDDNARMTIFDFAGQVRHQFGRKGEGPGDLRRGLWFVATDSDTLAIWDRTLNRMTRVDSTGTLVDVVTFPPGERRVVANMQIVISPLPRFRLADGRYVATTGATTRFNPPTGVYHDSAAYWLLDSLGAPTALATYPQNVDWIYETASGTSWFGPLPYAPHAADAFADSAWYRVVGDQFEIVERDWTGRTRRLIRTMRERRAVTAADRERAGAQGIAAEGDEYREERRPIFDWMPYPDSMPGYDRLLRDDTGRLWARVFPDTLTAATWDIFDATGRLLGVARVPSALDVRQIRADHLVALVRGDLGEPLVELYRLSAAD